MVFTNECKLFPSILVKHPQNGRGIGAKGGIGSEVMLKPSPVTQC